MEYPLGRPQLRLPHEPTRLTEEVVFALMISGPPAAELLNRGVPGPLRKLSSGEYRLAG
jgi:hypothetical protein